MYGTVTISKAPVKADIDKLEIAHKNYFAALVQAALFRIALAKKYGTDSSAFKAFNKLFMAKIAKFVTRQRRLEKKKIPAIISTGDLIKSFATEAGIKELAEIAKGYDKEGKGIGFIPLLIWAGLAIYGLFTVEEIVDETTHTEEEQKSLIDSTSKFCSDHGLTPEQCKDLLQTQTKAVEDKPGGGLFSGVLPWILLGGAVFLFKDQIFPKKQAA